MRLEVLGQQAFHGLPQRSIACSGLSWFLCRIAEFSADNVDADYLLAVERAEPANQVLELSHIAGPAVALQIVQRRAVELFRWQAFALDLVQEMSHEFRHIFR